MTPDIEANPDNKRPVRGRFQVRIAADWSHEATESIEKTTGASIISVDGPLVEGLVELEARANIPADRAVYDGVEAGLGVLAKVDGTQITVLRAE
jgi:hypothetical protein